MMRDLGRYLGLFLTALLLWMPPVAAQQAANPAIETVISQQLDAFKDRDGAGAFKHASPFIQGMFGDAQTFLGMVQAGYPQIYMSRSARFLKLEMVDGRLVQTVLIGGADGTFVTAAYEMVQIDGNWRINGVQLLRGEQA